MPVKQTKEQVKGLLEARQSGTKPTLFGEEVTALKSGEGLLILDSEWSLKSSPSSYYYSKFKRGKTEKSFTVSKVKEGYLITKI